MSKQLQDSMLEATRLTNEGRLAEATAAIQRALGGISAQVAPEEDTGGTEGPVETTARALEGATRRSLQRARTLVGSETRSGTPSGRAAPTTAYHASPAVYPTACRMACPLFQTAYPVCRTACPVCRMVCPG